MTREETSGSRLLRKIIDRGETQTSLAKAIGVGQAAISEWTRGISRPRAMHREVLKALYRIPVLSWLSESEKTRLNRKGRRAKRSVRVSVHL